MDEEKRDKAYRNLAIAVVTQAVNDYRDAILYNDSALERKCERFFESDWCQFLAGMSGKFLADKLRSETLSFRDLAYKLFDEKQAKNDISGNRRAFKCPTCGAWVSVYYDYVSKKAHTYGYTAHCRSCGLTVKRKISGEPVLRKD